MASQAPTWKSKINAETSGDFLFRFLNENYLKKFLDSGNIWFARGDTFGDKMECVSVRDFKNGAFDLSAMRDRQRLHYISCWHLNTHESLALWDAYAKTEASRRKYAIRFKKQDLIRLMIAADSRKNDIVFRLYGDLSYKNLISADMKTILAATVPHASLRKDKVFEYEKELRFVLRTRDEKTIRGINLHIGDPATLPFKILINPLLTEPDFAAALRFVYESSFAHKISFSKLTEWLNPGLAALIKKHTGTRYRKKA